MYKIKLVQKAQYAAMIEAFDGLIYICSQDYEIEFMNQRFIDRTGYDAIGQKCYKALHDREEICPWCVNERVFQGETVRWEMRSPKDNRRYYIVNTPIRHSDGSMSKMAMLQDISERKEMEEALRLAEEDYCGIIENAVEGIFRSRPDGRLICVNPAMAKIYGYDSPEEMVATIKDVEQQLYVDPGRRAFFKRLMEESGQVQGFEHQGYRKDHSLIWLSVNARTVKNDRGAILYYEGFVEDITDRKEAEEALLNAHDELEGQVAARTLELARVNQELRLRLEQLESAQATLREERQRLYSLLDGLPVGVHLVSPDYTIRFANRVFWEDFRGKSAGQLCYRLIHGREYPCEDCHAARVFETGIPQRFEDTLPSGKILQVSSYPFADIDGSPMVLILGIDITEQKRTEEKLQESEGRFRQLIEQAADAIFLHDQGKIVEVNQRACESLGYTRAELLGLTIFDLEIELPKNLIQKNWQQRNDQPRTLRGTHRRKDGSTFPVEVRAGNFEYGEHRLRLNLVRDISERVQAEQALKESEEKYRLLVNQIPAVVYQGYEDCTIDFFDRKVKEVTGYLKEEFDSRKIKWCDLILREDLSEARRIFIEGLKGDRSFVREYHIRRKDGKIRAIQDRGHIYCDDAGKLAYIKGIFFDITDKQNAEKKLRESEQNLRHLASELLHAQERERIRIAHELHDDLGQSLLLLKLQLSTIARGLPVELQEPRQECDASIDNVQEIIDSVRRLSHDLIPPTLSEIGLKSAINDLLEEFCRHRDQDYSLDMDDLKGLFSPDKELNIYRIVQESLTNIGKYAQATQVSVSLKRKDHEVRLSVEDNGNGFEVDQIQAHRDRKRGLGLASMEERARMMGGTFHLWSKPEKGTKIHINVPLIK